MKKHTGIIATVSLAAIIVPAFAFSQPARSPDAVRAAAYISEARSAKTASEKQDALDSYSKLSKGEKRYIPTAVVDRLTY